MSVGNKIVWANGCSCSLTVSLKALEDIEPFSEQLVSNLPMMVNGASFNFLSFPTVDFIEPNNKLMLHYQGFIQNRNKITAGDTLSFSVTYTTT